MKTKKNRAAGTALLAALLAGAAGCASFQSIEVTRPPARAVYGQGEEFDRTGMVVAGVTKKGEVKPVPDSRVGISGYDKSRPGVQTVTVAYRDTRTTIAVEVVPVASIRIETAPSLVRQYEHITGLTARVDYGGRVPAASVGAEELTFSGYNKDAAGRQIVTAAYYGKTAAFVVTVVGMTRLVINTPPAKATYLPGEELDLAGIKATGTWEGLGDAPVTPRYVSGFNPAVKGLQTIVVEANGIQAAFTVTVKEAADPLAWTPVTAGFAKRDLRVLTGIAYGGGIFAAIGYGGDLSESIAAYSRDGVTWAERETASLGFTVTGIFFAGGKFFFTGSTRDGKAVIQASSDGFRMDPDQYSYLNNIGEGSSRCTGIAYGGGAWVAVFDHGKAAYSLDGRRWDDIAIFMNDVWDGNTSVFFDGANFIALDASGWYRISPGTSRGLIGSSQHWDRGGGAVINGRPITGAAFGGGKWIGIGPDNAVGWSADGTTWTAADNVTAPNDGRLRRGDFTGAAYGAGMFVAVNNRGTIIYTRDGYNWTQVSSSTFGTTPIRAVAYGDGKFVAVGDNGRIAYARVVD